ncbi:Uncharacterised protein [uncultured archaeon]|nr:Uncharacterised protein [uncultured archaeon]
MPSKGKREPYEGENPEPPDPGEKGGDFLGWIKKRGFLVCLIDCDDYCKSIGLDLEEFARQMEKERILIGRLSGGNKAVKVVDRTWCSKWARKYERDKPHHRQKQRLHEPHSPIQSDKDALGNPKQV